MTEDKKTEAPKYKDTLFRALFGYDKAKIRELYGVVEDGPLPDEKDIEVCTLEGVLFRNKLNDISFKVGEKLITMVEHQSTFNPNISPSGWSR
jgi:hypothetical protein